MESIMYKNNNFDELLEKIQTLDSIYVKKNLLKILESYIEGVDNTEQMIKLGDEFHELSKNLHNLAQFIDKRFSEFKGK